MKKDLVSRLINRHNILTYGRKKLLTKYSLQISYHEYINSPIGNTSGGYGFFLSSIFRGEVLYYYYLNNKNIVLFNKNKSIESVKISIPNKYTYTWN